MEFFLNVFTEFSDKNICHYLKGLKSATSCVRNQDATTAPARHVRGRIFKLSPIHASDSLNLLIFTEFNESSDPFRKTSKTYIMYASAKCG